MSATVDPGLQRARQAILDAHSAAETRHDLDAVIATFHHPRYEIVPTGEVFDGEEAVRRYHGQNWVPVLVTDDGEVIQETKRIVEWARANPASGAEREAPTG